MGVGTVTAEQLVNNYSCEKLTQLFKQYGELKNSKRLAHTLCLARERLRITITSQLKEVISPCLPRI